MTVVKQCN